MLKPRLRVPLLGGPVDGGSMIVPHHVLYPGFLVVLDDHVYALEMRNNTPVFIHSNV